MLSWGGRGAEPSRGELPVGRGAQLGWPALPPEQGPLTCLGVLGTALAVAENLNKNVFVGRVGWLNTSPLQHW